MTGWFKDPFLEIANRKLTTIKLVLPTQLILLLGTHH